MNNYLWEKNGENMLAASDVRRIYSGHHIISCKESRLCVGRGPHLHQRTHQDHTESVRYRCAVELAAMAISKSSIKFGKPHPVQEGTRSNSDATQSDNENCERQRIIF